MQLGVQTHFSQGWNTSLLSKLSALGVTEIRDSQPWASVETKTGEYNFTDKLVRYMDMAENVGVNALLTFASANTLYDSGFTPYTAEGRQAYADYIVAVLTKYGAQVQEIEIWNEFNTNNFTGPADSDDARYYTELLKTVWNTVKAQFPDVKILGGSVNVIGVGALEAIFKLGALGYMDGVAVHPYRNSPEHVDDELTHLQEVMAKYGAVKPIYATEFGNQFENAADVPDFLLKMVTLMSSVHVEEAYWYALIDQSFYKNMGLYTTSGEEKPAAAAFAFIEHELLPHGDAVRIDTGDDLTLVYRFGADTYVMWSAGRDISFGAGGQYYNARGEEIAAPTSLTMTPIIVRGASYALGSSNVVADTLMQFGEGDWQYFAKDKDGKLTALTNVDWDWTSYLGSKYTKPLRVNADGIAPAGTGANPIQVVERFVSDRDQILKINGSWTTGGTGDGVDLHILINGVEILVKVFNGAFTLNGYEVKLKAGDTLDFSMGPNQFVGGDSTARHITLTRVETAAAAPIADMIGTAAADTLTGSAGKDFLQGLAGNDTLNGGGGDDLLSGGTGKNTIDGGEGFDTVTYADAASAVKVRLGAEGYQYPTTDRTDRLLNIEGVIGSRYDDIFYGTAETQTFSGGAGDDTFYASSGADTIDGGDGRDLVSFASMTGAVDISLSNAGRQSIGEADTIRLTSIENLIGTAFNDRLVAGDGGSELTGGTGDDILVSGAGGDRLIGKDGTDTVSYELARAGVAVDLNLTQAQATGGAGVDYLSGIESLMGSAFDDSLVGSKGDNRISAGAGNDTLTGGAGMDWLLGGAGADTFIFRATSDSRPGAYDTIADFSHAEGDRINLSAIDASTRLAGDQGFTLVDHFTRTAGQLVIASEKGGYLVEVDVNGDGLADFGLHVMTNAPLVGSDFYL